MMTIVRRLGQKKYFANVFFTLVGIILPLSSFAAWSTQRPEGSSPFGYWNTLALGSDQHPRIVYRDGSAGGNLRFLRWTGALWEKETIESSFDSNGGYASLALTPTGTPWVSYYKTGFGLRFASKDGPSWTIKTIDGQGGQYSSLKSDGAGMAHISYYSGSSLKYAKWDGVAWTTATVDGGGVGQWTSLALDTDNRPFISYYDVTNGDLKMAHWTGDAWVIQTVDSSGDVGKGSSLALNSYGFPGISYYGGTSLKIAQWNGSSWNIQSVDSGNGPGTSLAYDLLNNPVISYGASGTLKVVYFKEGSWIKTSIDLEDGEYSSLALSKDGAAHIAYGLTYFNYATNPALAHYDGVVSISSKTAVSISWIWIDTSTTEKGYRVLRNEDLSILVDNLPVNSTGWTQTGLTPNTTYQVQVQSYDDGAVIDVKSSSAYRTLAQTPGMTSVLSFSPTSVSLSWDSNSNPPGTIYKMERSTDATHFTSVYSGTSTATTISGLLENSTYYFRVQAENNESLKTSFNSTVSQYLPKAPPTPPGKPSATANTETTIAWSWFDLSTKEEGYRVLRATDLVPLSPDLPANTTYWMQIDLTPNTSFQTVVQAFNSGGVANSPPSNVQYTRANTPSDTAIASSSGTRIQLSWSENRNPKGTKYLIENSIDGVSFALLTTSSATSVVANGLQDLTTYYFRVRAVNDVSLFSGYDTTVSTFIPLAFSPPRPEGLFVKKRTSDTLLWNWSHDSPREEGFRILRASDSFVLATLPANTTYWAQELGPNVNSQIQVEAFNSIGNSVSDRSYYSWQEYTLANPPGDIAISSVTATTVSLWWEPNGNPDDTYYTGYISTDGVTFKTFSKYNNRPPMRATGLESEKTYTFQIAAGNGSFEESLSDLVLSTRTPLGPPGQANPYQKANFYGSIDWAWENQPNALGYRIYSEGGKLLAERSAGQNTWTQMGLDTYAFSEIQVEAYNMYGSSWSLFGYGRSLANLPTDLHATEVNRTAAALAWSENGNPKTVYYRIEKTIALPFPRYPDWDDTKYVWDGSTSANIGGLLPGTTYYFRVLAANNDYQYGSYISVVTSTGMDAPTSKDVTTDSIVWRWNDDIEGETGYRITQSSNEADLSGIIPADQFSWTQTALEPNTPYSVTLQAEGPFGVSKSPRSKDVYTLPRSPKNVRLVGVGAEKISLAWNGNGNPPGTRYLVFEEGTYPGEVEVFRDKLAEVEGTSTTLHGLYAQRTYHLVVVAQGPSGESERAEGIGETPLVVTTLPKPQRFFTSEPTLVVETVDREEDTGRDSAIFLNDNGYPTIIYGSGKSEDLKMASFNGSWDKRVLVSNTGVTSKISALQAWEGQTILTYHSSREGRLKLGYGPPYTFGDMPMDSISSGDNTISFSGQGFMGTSLVLSKDLEPLVAYSSIFPGTGDNPFICFFYVATYAPLLGEWEKSLVFSKVLPISGNQKSSGTGDIKLAIDSKGAAHVVFFHCNDRELFPTAVGDIIYAQKQGDIWVNKIIEQKVATETTAIDLKIDSQDRPHILYSDPVHKLVRHAVKMGGSWSIENIDEKKSVGFVAMAIDGKDTPHVAYTDIEESALYYSKQVNGHWDHRMIEENESEVTGWFPSLAIDSFDNVHMAYQGADHQSLKYATLGKNPAEIKSLISKEGGHFEFSSSQGPGKIDIPGGTFSQSVLVTLRAPGLFPVSTSGPSDMIPMGIGLEIGTDPSETPTRPVRITLSYDEESLGGRAESHLVLAYFDGTKGEWVPVPTQVNAANNQLTANMTNVSLLQVFYKDIVLPTGDITAFPNPMRPGIPGYDTMTFSNLPEGTQIKIYTLHGELVRELDATQALWNGRNSNGESVSSGVYFVRIHGPGADETIKVAVQR